MSKFIMGNCRKSKNKRKNETFLTMGLSEVILAAALSGCGAKSNETAAPADSKSSSVSSDSKDVKTDEKTGEEKGDDSENSNAKAEEKPKASTESDFSFEDFQNNYAILHDVYDFVEEALYARRNSTGG